MMGKVSIDKQANLSKKTSKSEKKKDMFKSLSTFDMQL